MSAKRNSFGPRAPYCSARLTERLKEPEHSVTTAATPLHVQVEEKRASALRLRSQGATYREIAAELDMSLAYAYQLVQEGLTEVRLSAQESADDARAIEIERLDRQQRLFEKKLASQAEAPKEETGLHLLRIAERRARLLGLDAPQEIVGAGGGPLQVSNVTASEEFIDRVEKLVARLAGGESPEAVALSLRVPAESADTNGAGPTGSHPSTNGASHA